MSTNHLASRMALPSQRISGMIDDGYIYCSTGDDLKSRIQPASLDLKLGPEAFRLQSSFLPQSRTAREGIEELVMYKVNLEPGAVLEKEAVYLIPLAERLKLPANIMGKTNPKSSTGRLDVFTRVITDHCRRFEDISPGYEGEMFLEVVPRSFTIKVKAGQNLNQLRLYECVGATEECDTPSGAPCPEYRLSALEQLYNKWKLLYDDSGQFIENRKKHLDVDGLLMGVDFDPAHEGPIGYKAKKNSQVIELDKIGEYEPGDFWEAIAPPRNGKLILEPEEFYIFASKERVRVPLDCAAEMVEFDAGSGELRTHYAGFFDPGFGFGEKGGIKGTKAVLEVRPHDVPFILEDGQILFKMKYEAMSAPPAIWYGEEIGSSYYNQALRLAKQFRSARPCRSARPSGM